ncbi:uncharacterized protein LOC134460719 isoform X2 [Engraulis encrasicolus]|uniref:uncharacterized protein LOC134460719 isoform X2 n=1 Tax=Engraulis encrasicolus TaxID=184585 RepID=UPI002FD1E046
MSTCALLLVSQAACGLPSESPQPPPQPDLSEHCMPAAGHRLLSAARESNTLGECIERFQAANYCGHFGARGGDLSHFFESSFRGDIVVQGAPPALQNMPAAGFAEQSPFSGREEHRDGQDESFDRTSGLNAVDLRNSLDLSEDCEFRVMNTMTERHESGEMKMGDSDSESVPDLPEQVTESLSVHSESSQKTEEIILENNISCVNLVTTTTNISDQKSVQRVQSEQTQTQSIAEQQSSKFESSNESRSVEPVSETLELGANLNLNSVPKVPVCSDKCGPLYTEVTDPNLERTESFKQCEACTQSSSTVQVGACIDVSESEVLLDEAFEKPSKRDREPAAEVCQSFAQSMPAANCELGENPTPTDLETTTCKVVCDTFVAKPSDMGDTCDQPVSSEAAQSHSCSSSESRQQTKLSNKKITPEEMRLNDTSTEESGQPSESSVQRSKTVEQCESSKHCELAKQCGSLDSCAKYSHASKINKPCQHHNTHCEQLKEQQKTRRSKSESDILLYGSMDAFEALWISQFVVKQKRDTLELLEEEYECCENCDLCERFSQLTEVSECRPNTAVSCGGATQQEDKLQTCGHSSESSNSEVSVHCLACQESDTTKRSTVSCHNKSSQHRRLSEGFVQPQVDNLQKVCTDVKCNVHRALDVFLNQNGLLQINGGESRNIIRSKKPDVESLDESSEGEDYHLCREKSHDSSETEGSFKTCSDGSECDEICSVSSFGNDKPHTEEEEEVEVEENVQFANESFEVRRPDSPDSFVAEDRVEEAEAEEEDGPCECILECEAQSCDYLWTEEPRRGSAELLDGEFYEEQRGNAELLDGELYEEEEEEDDEAQACCIEGLYVEEDSSEPDSSEGDLSIELCVDGGSSTESSELGTGEVYEDGSVETTPSGSELEEPAVTQEDKVSQVSIAHALYQSQTAKYFLERRKLSQAQAYGHYAGDACRLDLIFDPWTELEMTKEKEAAEAAAAAEKEKEEEEEEKEKEEEEEEEEEEVEEEEEEEEDEKEEEQCQNDDVKAATLSPNNCECCLIIPEIVLSESPDDETNDEEIVDTLEKSEGLLSCPEIPYGIEISETPEPLFLDFTPDQGEGLSECVDKTKMPEPKRSETPKASLSLSDLITQVTKSEKEDETKMPEPKRTETPKASLSLSDLITQQTKPEKEKRVDHVKTSEEHNVESTDHSEQSETSEFFKRKTPEPSETTQEDESEDDEEEEEEEEDTEPCQCEFCVPTEEVPAKPLLPQIKSKDAGKICVVIDLDETLVHSSFKPVNNADFIIPVEIDGTVHQVYVLKRPHVDEFLKRMGELFECVLFTASLAKYADPVSDLLDKWGAFRSRLFRESCVFHRGNYVKDLSRLGRDLNKVIIIDNSPASYIFHPDNAVRSL